MSDEKDLRIMGYLMGMPVYIDVQSKPNIPDAEDPSVTVRDKAEVQARAILYQATQALVHKVEKEQGSEEDQQ